MNIAQTPVAKIWWTYYFNILQYELWYEWERTLQVTSVLRVAQRASSMLWYQWNASSFSNTSAFSTHTSPVPSVCPSSNSSKAWSRSAFPLMATRRNSSCVVVSTCPMTRFLPLKFQSRTTIINGQSKSPWHSSSSPINAGGQNGLEWFKINSDRYTIILSNQK